MVYCVFISALNQQVPSKGATNYDIMTCSNINDFAVFTVQCGACFQAIIVGLTTRNG